MLGLIGALLFLYWVGTTFGERAGAVVVLIYLAIVVVGFFKYSGDEAAAYANWIRYWKHGGPERRR